VRAHVPRGLVLPPVAATSCHILITVSPAGNTGTPAADAAFQLPETSLLNEAQVRPGEGLRGFGRDVRTHALDLGAFFSFPLTLPRCSRYANTGISDIYRVKLAFHNVTVLCLCALYYAAALTLVAAETRSAGVCMDHRLKPIAGLVAAALAVVAVR